MSAEEPKSSKALIAMLLFAGIVTGVMAFRQIFAEARSVTRQAPMPVLGQAPEFLLTRESGEMFPSRALENQVWIADFIFTRCAGPCPRMTQKMADLQRDLAGTAGVKLVSFTVDPEYDTPKVLREYAQAFEADPTRWAFVTGDRKKIHDLSIKGFRMAVGADPADENQILHSTRFILMDRKGRIRGYYDETDPEQMARLADDARALAAESGE